MSRARHRVGDVNDDIVGRAVETKRDATERRSVLAANKPPAGDSSCIDGCRPDGVAWSEKLVCIEAIALRTVASKQTNRLIQIVS